MKSKNKIMTQERLTQPDLFSEILFKKLKGINSGLEEFEFYEFNYALENLVPKQGWNSVKCSPQEQIENQINSVDYYQSIQLKSIQSGKMVLDSKIENLTQMLFVGLVTDFYPQEWIVENFYFDIRGFFFLHITNYFPETVLTYLGGLPFKTFPKNQKKFDKLQAISYKEFRTANQELDQCFIELVLNLIAIKGTPLIFGIAGPTAAGKTEIVARLRYAFELQSKKICVIEMDNFLLDRDYREQHGLDSLGKEALHFNLLLNCLEEIQKDNKIFIPQYNFISATSSHDEFGNLKPGAAMLGIEPADIIFMEGNFPFLFPELKNLVGLKVVYLTSDEIRMKRKWRRDMDLRKKYELNYFRNRYFREQFIMAGEVYIPQMLMCDMVVDTTNATLWASKNIREFLNQIKLKSNKS
ncbi:MAG: uridine kinase family protein [Anaerolineaceae bacterium]